MRLPNVQLPAKFPVKLAVMGAVGMALAGGAFAAFSFTANASRPAANSEPVVRPARVAEISYKKQSQALLLAGTVVPRIESTLGFRVSGKIVQRSVDVGAVVQAGDVIATLDPADYRLAVDNARAALASADADYARARADHERYLNLRGSTAFRAADARPAPVARLDGPRPRRPGEEPAFLGGEQSRLHRAACRCGGCRHRRPGEKSAR